VSSLDPGTALAPFSFVLIISLIREAFEDLKKTRFDKLYNNSPTQVWKDSYFKTTKWKDVGVGQITKVEKNEIIPADLLVLKSSQENGFCYLETTNLDGESALKPRESMIITNTGSSSEDHINSMRGFIEVDPPNNDIYTVEGTLFLEGYERSYFDINNVLLRGGRLKNVDWVWGLVIYTGKDTKIMKNIKQGSLKLSSIDTKLNKIVIYILIIVIFLCVICTTFGAFFRNDHLADMTKNSLGSWYLFTIVETFSVLEVIKIFGADFIIFNTLIPISLMISYQVVKGFQIVLIERDPELAKDLEDQVKTFSIGLHEDLGSIKYIFSDKTGTLTRNEMEFKALSNFTKLFDDEDEENRELEAKNINDLNNLNNLNNLNDLNHLNNLNDLHNLYNRAKNNEVKYFLYRSASLKMRELIIIR
jgi:magnesium-transporting ATPase (P-type)